VNATRRPLRVVLDARPLSHPQAGGFHSYVRSLVRGLDEVRAPDVEVLLYLDRPLGPKVAPFVPPWIKQRVLSPSRLKADWVFFARQAAADNPDLVHGTMNYLPQRLPRRIVRTVTIHDAMGIKPYAFTTKVKRNARERAMHGYWKRLTRVSAKQAKRILTVSRAAKEDIVDALGAGCAARITVVYNGISLPLPTPAALAPGQRDARSVLAIGSPDPRKNVDLLYESFARHGDRLAAACGGVMPRLDVVCGSTLVADRAEAALAAHGVTHFALLRDLGDAALSDRLARSAVFAFPSRMEGFGYPPLEAMQAGCAVAASDAPCMPEVLGNVPLYFHPDHPEELADRIAYLLANNEERAERGRRGQAHAAQYTPRRAAEETLNVWREAVSTPEREEKGRR
jgi:glycosyltransferase involved in cell wall biosynthesis